MRVVQNIVRCTHVRTISDCFNGFVRVNKWQQEADMPKSSHYGFERKLIE